MFSTIYDGQSAVVIPYLNENREWTGRQLRLPIGRCSDVWSGQLHGYPTLGIPGGNAWKETYKRFFPEPPIVWEEPDKAGESLVLAVARDLPDARVIRGDEEIKDVNDLHRKFGDAFDRELERRLARVVPIFARCSVLLAHRSFPVSYAPGFPPRATVNDGEKSALIERARHTDLRSVLARYGIQGNWSGSGSKTIRCPFPDHDDHDPSFSVYRTVDGRWRFHCFGCGASGDTIAFVRKWRGYDFMQAVQELAS